MPEAASVGGLFRLGLGFSNQAACRRCTLVSLFDNLDLSAAGAAQIKNGAATVLVLVLVALDADQDRLHR